MDPCAEKKQTPHHIDPRNKTHEKRKVIKNLVGCRCDPLRRCWDPLPEEGSSGADADGKLATLGTKSKVLSTQFKSELSVC